VPSEPSLAAPIPEADRDELTGLLREFFAAFSSGPDVEARLDRLSRLFVAEAVITKTCGAQPVHYDVEQFIAPRRQLLTSGRITEFAEWPVSGSWHCFGDIPHWFGRYAKSWQEDGGELTGAGMKSLQFVRTAAGWRISAAAWDDQRPGLRLPG